MALTQVQICNMALGHVGGRRLITDINEATPEANQCLLWWDTSRLTTLEMYDWSFARRDATLAVHADAPTNGVWAFRYTLPADYVAARYIVNPLGPLAPPAPFEVKLNIAGTAKTLLTDVENAVLVYTMDQTALTLWTYFAALMQSYVLGHLIAYKLKGDLNLKAQLIQQAIRLAAQAPAQDKNSEMQRATADSPSITGR